MLGEADVQATIAVKDIEEATRFYGGVLGLGVVTETPYMLVYRSGNCQLNVYVSEFAGSNKATYATWEVDDIEDKVDRLKGENVTFEHYDLPDTTLEGDIHVMENEKAAWFQDPDGNILCLHSQA